MIIWSDIPNHNSQYQIPKAGCIKRLATVGTDGRELPEIELKQGVDSYGYKKVAIFNKRKFVHRLLAITFIPNPENKPQVNHINGIKADNRLSNLEWATRSENIRHAYANNLIMPKRGGGHHMTEYNDCDILIIKKILDTGVVTPVELAKLCGMAPRTMYNIKSGATWTHINLQYV